MRSIAVVGASLAGVEAARALRAAGFDGRLVVVGEESHPPYDRPPLSKGFLDRTVERADLALAAVEDVELRLGATATGLDAHAREVLLADGRALRVDGVVVATGARARRFPTPLGPEAGVHVLRTLDDASALRDDLVPGARLVVVGGGFIGAEVAATARQLGLDVTIVETQARLLLAQLGAQTAAFLADVHEARGVKVLTGRPATEITGGRRVDGVRLADGTRVPADVVLVGIGTEPAVEWLHGSGLAVADGVACDPRGRASLPAVVAVGDCAAWAGPTGGRARRQHWTAALRHAGVGAATLLGAPDSDALPADLDYVWSDQYDLRLQVAGRPGATHAAVLIAGSVDDGRYTLVFRDDDHVIHAVTSVNDPRSFGRWRRRLGTRHAEVPAPS